MIFIGGLQPKTVVVDPAPRICDRCGLARARLVRVDQYLSLFFIPVFRIKTGDEMTVCDRCGPVGMPPLQRSNRICMECGRVLDSDFQFCPGCGNPVPKDRS